MSNYFPLLRWKEGEQSALANLIPAVRRLITPIIDFPANCDFSHNRMIEFCEAAGGCLGQSPFYLDLGDVSCNNYDGTGVHPALTLMRNARAANLNFIPVARTDNDDPLIMAFAQALAERLAPRVAIRVFEDEGVVPANEDVTSLFEQLNQHVASSDLILDMNEVNGRIDSQVRDLASWVGEYGRLYRTTIMLAGSMPGDLFNHIPENSIGLIPRHEWALWRRARRNADLDHVRYGDYATVQVNLPETAFAGSPRNKYTLNEGWVIARGHMQRRGENQRQVLARAISGRPDFRGSAYSFGDARILSCATGQWGPGNNTQWVSIDINQHLTFVANQVSAILAGI